MTGHEMACCAECVFTHRRLLGINMKKLILSGILMLSSHVFAQSAATVLFTEKKVVANHNGIERSITRGATLGAGDEVITESDALANIQYENGALVNIGSSSRYKILAYSPQKSVQIKAELSHGKIEIKTPEKIKEQLKTPLVSMAILGTDVRVYVPSQKITYIQVIEGLVWAKNEYLRAGSSVAVTKDHIVKAEFPKEGIITSSINGTTSSMTGSDSAVDIVTQASTVQLVGSSTVMSIQAIQAASIVGISLSCLG